MKRVLWLLRMAVALCFVLPTSCATSPESVPAGASARSDPKVVKVSELPGGRLRLSFDPLSPTNPALEMMKVEEARALLAVFQESFRVEDRHQSRLVLASTGPAGGLSAEWELRLREEFLSRYGPPLLPLPQSLETSPLFLALRLSPRYMSAGVREAAQELFSSPVFLSSVTLSVLVYFAAWMAPEPIFTKAFVAALTLRLSLAVGVLELTQLARACVQLYREAEAARTVRELEAVAERFGKAMGGTALRALVLVASMGVARGMPQVPKGGLWALLGEPRFAMAGGMTMEGATTVRMVADGTVVVTGVAAGTAAATLRDACSDGSQKREGSHWHHLATNKNDTSTAQGGPWTPLFKKLFAKAGMDLDAAENRVYLAGHQGPHPEAYHEEVYERLSAAVSRCRTVSQCRSNLQEALQKLADEVCTSGSRLHRLATNA